ncbi:MAG: class I SAM-dependent methyltransferase [bacterium]
MKQKGAKPSWSILPPDLMQSLLEETKAKGWQKAILSSKNKKIRDIYLFTDSPARADGSFYLSLTPESRVLDLGAGLGSYAFALAPRVASVVAADATLESLEFIKLRASQDKVNNLTTVQIEPLDYAKLPFPDQSFDAIIMNGVLEWVGSYVETDDPLRLQENCLREVRRVLKPFGELWLGIENRFGRRYFNGAPDDHLKYYQGSKIAYTTIVPRFVANLITRKKLGQPYRTYTHSLPGYKRLLKRTGFKETQFFYPDPDYRAVAVKITPIESKAVVNPIFCDSYFILGRGGQ